MEKKRKRASFSANLPTLVQHESDPKGEEAGKAEESQRPVVQQVVEVIVEEPPTIPQTSQPKEEMPQQQGEVTDVVQEMTETRPLSEEAEEAEEEKLPSEVSDKPRITHGVLPSEPHDEQKRTVAELFSKNTQTMMPEITVHKSSNTRGIILWAVTMLAIAVGIGGGLLLFTNRTTKTSKIIPPNTTNATPISTPTAVPTPTVLPVKRGDITIQVLNGGGVPGAGSKTKAFLENKGYKVSDVSNAPSYTYDKTQITIKASKAAGLSLLKDDLSDTYNLGSMDTTLPESTPYDAQVIVGK